MGPASPGNNPGEGFDLVLGDNVSIDASAGAWLTVGSQQIHLLELPNPDPVKGRPEHGGRDRHTAFYVSDIDILIKSLEQNSITFTRSRSGRSAIFCRDPDGNALEFIEA